MYNQIGFLTNADLFQLLTFLSRLFPEKYANSMQMKKGLKLESSETLYCFAPPSRLERETL